MAQTAAREAITQGGPAVDADMQTLHVRCGSDIKGELEAARFSGDFLAVWDSFPVGPVTDAPDWIAQRARFHADTGTVDRSGLRRAVSRSSPTQTADSLHLRRQVCSAWSSGPSTTATTSSRSSAASHTTRGRGRRVSSS